MGSLNPKEIRFMRSGIDSRRSFRKRFKVETVSFSFRRVFWAGVAGKCRQGDLKHRRYQRFASFSEAEVRWVRSPRYGALAHDRQEDWWS